MEKIKNIIFNLLFILFLFLPAIIVMPILNIILGDKEGKDYCDGEVRNRYGIKEDNGEFIW